MFILATMTQFLGSGFDGFWVGESAFLAATYAFFYSGAFTEDLGGVGMALRVSSFGGCGICFLSE